MTASQPRASAIAALAAATLMVLRPVAAIAWGDEGHEIVARIAAQAMDPRARAAAEALLATDESGLTAHDLASESTWADRYRDTHPGTRDWHYIDNEIRGAALANPGQLVAKINEFRATLADRAAPPAARLMALQFLLHLVGDLHQPLHAADDHDRGGNDVQVIAPGFARGTLHHYWDTVFVGRLGEDPQQVADRLLAGLGADDRARAVAGTPADWATESFHAAVSSVYTPLPPADAQGTRLLDARYVNDATALVSHQLVLAGLRLARILDEALH